MNVCVCVFVPRACGEREREDRKTRKSVCEYCLRLGYRKDCGTPIFRALCNVRLKMLQASESSSTQVYFDNALIQCARDPPP